ncbi:MAG: histone deacetylase family protein [Rhodocyclaceae bacterium]|nr:histone deacetylase family protein [Rhodocyclaceae bacterium]
MMQTAYITHTDCLKHEMGSHHPECPARLHAIRDELIASRLDDYLKHYEAPLAQDSQLMRVHDAAYVESILAASPQTGMVELDGDTMMTPYSLQAAYRAAGGAVMAVDLVRQGMVANAFVACRPPGHHAMRDRAMGFCIFNNLAVAVAHALTEHGVKRAAIVDFDVHHGNGTEDIFRNDPRVLLCSTFQHPFYPGCGADTVNEHIVNVPLPAGTTGSQYREAFTEHVLPRLANFQPDMLFFSAGFDGHRDDDMGQFNLTDDDYRWITQESMTQSATSQVISILEGGYNLPSLGRSAAAHIRVLAGL